MKFLIIIITFIGMEGLTWLIHKYVMHGFLWTLHRDHHDHSSPSFFERNDYFFIIFSLPAIVLIVIGTLHHFNVLFFIGIGVTIYGFAYLFVHDLFIHQRIKILTHTKNPYLLAIRRAHKQHHKYLGKEDGECFGFLWVPKKYYKFNSKKSK